MNTIDVVEVIDNSRLSRLQVLVLVLVLVLVPESIHFMVMHQRKLSRVREWLRRIDDTLHLDDAHLQVRDLVRDSRGLGTAMLWILCMNLLGAYFLASWLPVIMHGAGVHVRDSRGGNCHTRPSGDLDGQRLCRHRRRRLLRSGRAKRTQRTGDSVSPDAPAVHGGGMGAGDRAAGIDPRPGDWR